MVLRSLWLADQTPLFDQRDNRKLESPCVPRHTQDMDTNEDLDTVR